VEVLQQRKGVIRGSKRGVSERNNGVTEIGKPKKRPKEEGKQAGRPQGGTIETGGHGPASDWVGAQRSGGGTSEKGEEESWGGKDSWGFGRGGGGKTRSKAEKKTNSTRLDATGFRLWKGFCGGVEGKVKEVQRG